MDRAGENILPTAVGSNDPPPSENSTLTIFLERISTLLKQRNFQDALEQCESALQIFGDHEKLQEKKIKILCHQGRFDESFEYAQKWVQRDPTNKLAQKELKRLRIVIQALRDQDSDDNEGGGNDSDDLIVESVSEEGNIKHDSHHQSPITTTLTRDTASPSSHKDDQDHCCTFCDIKFSSFTELETHCRSDLHKKRITSDEDQSWQFRIPPRNLTSEEFTLCRSYAENSKCNFGDKCTQAHSKEELNEWKERFKFRKQQIKIARDKHLHGNTYAEQLMEKLVNADNSKCIMTQNVEYAKIHVNSELKVNMTTKKCTNAWTFTITSKRSLHRVTLLDDTNRTYFYIASISVGPKKTQKYQNLETHCQEWVNPDYTTRHVGEYVYRVKVVFKTDIYGTFRQTLVYDFGLEPVLSREVQIESAPITDVEKLSKNLILNEQGRWRPENVQLIEYDSRPVPATEDEKHLLKKYCLPEAEKFRLGEHLMHPPSKETYRIWMHEMLYIEEWAQLEHISRFNVKTSLQLVNKFMLIPGALTGAKYAQTGELFAKMLLHDDLSEDSAGGRLILQSAHLAWLAPYNPEDKQDSKQVRKVYEVLLEDKGKNFIFFRLSNKCVEELNLSCDQEFHAEVQFQLNRLPKCEQHAAIDRLPTLDLVFPPSHPTESWFSEDVTFSEMVSTKLNKKQKDAIQGITAGRDLCLPPLLLIGPYGTGKTYTLAQAAVQALEDKDAKILICTHSNSAADIYIKDFIHPIVKEGHLEALPLRIYYRHRWVQTVPDVVLQYCLLEMSASQGNFRMPTREDVEKHRIIITTLSTARYLCDLDLPQGFFSHIFVDEAAQAMESETLIPLSLSGRTTKIVLCGDHMQLNPEVYSDFAKQQGFHKNLLDRLYEFYPDSCPCKIMLCENYRSHAAIIDFTSDLFYDSQLDSSGDQPLHPAYYPLTFFSTRGEDLQHQNSTGFYNIAEVHEVVDRVDDLQKNWPTEWGEIEGNIGVVAPYSDQVVRIRGELRKRKLFNVSVERVFNVQGKQFRAIILSTVRTRHTCSADSSQEDFVDYGFLSNVKLLNTALTRAQSLVIVVGDPLSLCLVGKCRKVWEYFLEICNDHKSLYGMKWSVLRAQLNSAELRKTYVLNPLAPEFVPNRLYHVTHNMGLPGSGSQSSQQQAGYFLGQRMMYPNNPYQHQQMYQPYMHMPYQGYYPPMMYRAYMPPFVGSRGNRVSSRVVYPRQMTPAVSLANSGRATPDKERASPDVVRSTESPQSVNVKKTHTTHSSQRGRPMVYIPRVQTPFQAMYYNPYHQPYPGYYILPEDPRLSAAAALHPHRYPYYPGTGLQPQHMLPHHYTGAPFMPATVIRPQYQPAAAEGGVVQGEGDTKRKVNSPTYSPAVSPGSTVTGQHIQLLPNARHIPVHLYNRAGTPNSSSRSSTPMGGRDSPDYSSEEGRRGVEPDYLKSISPKLDMQERRASAQSPLARVISQRQGYVAEEVLQVSQSRTQAVTSSMQYNASLIVSRESTSPIHNGERRDGGLSNRRKEGRKMPAKLDISTGFSRQFSEDIETPTEITNLVRMIDETIDEKAEFDARDDMSPVQNSFASRLSSKSSSGKLYLNIPKRASLDTSGGSASSSSPSASPTGSDDRKPTYAGVLRRRLPTSSEEIDASLLEPQTPHTPAGFVSPSDEIDTDPLGILRNLNINASTENQRTYKYFS